MGIALKEMQALDLMRRAFTAGVRSDAPDLTARQMALLLIVYLTAPPHTVRGLAAQLSVTKPVITRAVDTLSALELVRRKTDVTDRRNVLIVRTVKGSVHLRDFAERIVRAGGETNDG